MIVVTAPTSTIGSQVVQSLLDRKAPLRLVARDPARLPDGLADRVEVVRGSHSDPDVVARAFAGADTVFWLTPPNPQAPSLEAAYPDFTRPACEVWARGGVQRVVGVSALGLGAPNAGSAGLVTASLQTDELIAGSGVAYRALALPGFMDNVLRQATAIRDEGVYSSVVSGDRKNPTCATRDIAAVATSLLLDGSWTGVGRVPVLGPEDLSCNDMAAIMSEVLDRPVRYRQDPPDEFVAGLLAAGHSEAMARGMLDMMLAKDDGLDNAEPRTPETTSPTTFRRWCEEVLARVVLGR